MMWLTLADREYSRYQNLTWRLPTVTKYDPFSAKETALTLEDTLFEATLTPLRQSHTLTIMSCWEPTDTTYL